MMYRVCGDRLINIRIDRTSEIVHGSAVDMARTTVLYPNSFLPSQVPHVCLDHPSFWPEIGGVDLRGSQIYRT